MSNYRLVTYFIVLYRTNRRILLIQQKIHTNKIFTEFLQVNKNGASKLSKKSGIFIMPCVLILIVKFSVELLQMLPKYDIFIKRNKIYIKLLQKYVKCGIIIKR